MYRTILFIGTKCYLVRINELLLIEFTRPNVNFYGSNCRIYLSYIEISLKISNCVKRVMTDLGRTSVSRLIEPTVNTYARINSDRVFLLHRVTYSGTKTLLKY